MTETVRMPECENTSKMCKCKNEQVRRCLNGWSTRNCREKRRFQRQIAEKMLIHQCDQKAPFDSFLNALWIRTIQFTEEIKFQFIPKNAREISRSSSAD